MARKVSTKVTKNPTTNAPTINITIRIRSRDNGWTVDLDCSKEQKMNEDEVHEIITNHRRVFESAKVMRGFVEQVLNSNCI